MVSIEAWRSHHVCQTRFDMFWRYSLRERLDVGQLQSLWTGGHPSCSAKGGERIFKCLAPCCWKPHEQATEFRWDQMTSNADALCSREFFLRYACKCRRRPTDSVDCEFETKTNLEFNESGHGCTLPLTNGSGSPQPFEAAIPWHCTLSHSPLPAATWSLRLCLMPWLQPWRARDLSLSRWEVLLLVCKSIFFAAPLQCCCNAPAIPGHLNAMKKNEHWYRCEGMWRCLNAQIPSNPNPMIPDASWLVWPRCSSSSSATLVRRASSSLIWRTAVVLRKRVKKPARSAAKFQQNHCYHRCSLHILRFDMIWHDLTWRLFRWHSKLELRFQIVESSLVIMFLAPLACNGLNSTGCKDCTITMADADLVAMAEGKLDGMQAFMGGKLKIKGNMMLAQKLQSILEAAKWRMWRWRWRWSVSRHEEAIMCVRQVLTCFDGIV